MLVKELAENIVANPLALNFCKARTVLLEMRLYLPYV